MTKGSVYDLLALLNQHFRDTLIVLRQIETCPGQRSILLSAYRTEIEYVRAQANFEVTTQASEFEQDRATDWGRKHVKWEKWLQDPDDVYYDVRDREQWRRKKGLAPRVRFLSWSRQKDEETLAKKLKARKRK